MTDTTQTTQPEQPAATAGIDPEWASYLSENGLLPQEAATPETASEAAPVTAEQQASTGDESPAENNTTETEAATEEEAAKADPKASKLLAIAQKKEKFLKEKENELRSKEQHLVSFQEALKQAKEDPTKLLEAAGLSVDDLIDYFSKGKIEPKQEDKVTQLERKLAELEQQRLRQEQENIRIQAEAQWNNFKSNVFSDIDKSSCQYIKAFQAQDVVIDLITEHFKQTEQVLTTQQAISLVEQELKQSAEKAGLGFVNTGNVEAAKKVVAKPQQSKGPVKTLSNNLQGQPVSREDKDLTEEEREAAAMQKLREFWQG